MLDGEALSPGFNGARAHQVRALRDLQRHGAVAIDKTLAEAELDHPHERVDGDQGVGNDWDRVPVRVVVSKRHDHAGFLRLLRNRRNPHNPEGPCWCARPTRLRKSQAGQTSPRYVPGGRVRVNRRIV